VSVQCEPVKCESQDKPPQCTEAGFVTVTWPSADNPCCPETLCGEHPGDIEESHSSLAALGHVRGGG
jgi:hypothetical protein